MSAPEIIREEAGKKFDGRIGKRRGGGDEWVKLHCTADDEIEAGGVFAIGRT